MAGRSNDYDVVDGQHVAITPEIEEYARIIRETFTEARRSYNPLAGKVGKAHWGHFLKAAFMCQRLGEKPAEFAMRQVEQMAKMGKFFPAMLHSQVLSTKGVIELPQKTDQSLGFYRAQFVSLSELLRVFTPAQAILHPSADFSPLFRCCIAVRLGLSDAVNRLRKAALQELAAHPVAHHVFKDEVAKL